MAPKPTTHSCNKEWDISEIRTNMKNVENSVNRIENKIDNFINRADEVYVTKELLKSVNITIDNTTNRVSNIEWNINKLVRTIITFIIIAALTLIFKK